MTSQTAVSRQWIVPVTALVVLSMFAIAGVAFVNFGYVPASATIYSGLGAIVVFGLLVLALRRQMSPLLCASLALFLLSVWGWGLDRLYWPYRDIPDISFNGVRIYTLSKNPSQDLPSSALHGSVQHYIHWWPGSDRSTLSVYGSAQLLAGDSININLPVVAQISDQDVTWTTPDYTKRGQLHATATVEKSVDFPSTAVVIRAKEGWRKRMEVDYRVELSMAGTGVPRPLGKSYNALTLTTEVPTSVYGHVSSPRFMSEIQGGVAGSPVMAIFPAAAHERSIEFTTYDNYLAYFADTFGGWVAAMFGFLTGLLTGRTIGQAGPRSVAKP